jgi:hypothetical protein
MSARPLVPPNAQAQPLPKAVRWNEGSDAEQFMSTAFQTVLLELMHMCKAICLLWLVRRIWICIHMDVEATPRALLRESHNLFLREDPKALYRKIDRRYQLCGIVFCYPPIERHLS